VKIDLKKEISLPKLSLPKRGSSPKDPSSSSRFSLPNVSLPTRSRALNGPKGPSVKMPKLVTDLYGDLRDRPLLLGLVLFLIAAIVIAPFALSDKGGSGEPAEVAPITGSGETANSSFSVVPAETTLRSPDKVDHRSALNPFRELPSGGGSGKGGSQAESSGGSSGGGSNVGSTTESGGGSEAPAAVETPSSESSSGSGSEASSPPTVTETTEHNSTTTETETSTEVTTSQNPDFVVSMKVGYTTGKLQEETEVQPMTKLPDDKEPALLYIGLSQDEKRALFLMTSKVTAYYGAAHCALDKAACELVELKPGKSATFEIGIGEDAKRYKIVLGKIEEATPSSEESDKKTVTKTHSKGPASNSAEQANALAQARSFSK
jgi:hypothetical protein